MMLSFFMFCTLTFDGGFRFWSALLVVKFSAGCWGFHMGLFCFCFIILAHDRGLKFSPLFTSALKETIFENSLAKKNSNQKWS